MIRCEMTCSTKYNRYACCCCFAWRQSKSCCGNAICTALRRLYIRRSTQRSGDPNEVIPIQAMRNGDSRICRRICHSVQILVRYVWVCRKCYVSGMLKILYPHNPADIHIRTCEPTTAQGRHSAEILPTDMPANALLTYPIKKLCDILCGW